MKKQREHWGSQLGLVMAAAGSAIGLGTLWKFPYVTGHNGGGLFVLIYLLCTFFIGIPIFVAELAVGRAGQRGAVGSFMRLDGAHSKWKVVGWFGVLSAFIILSYYSVVAGWGLSYVLMSLGQVFVGKEPAEVEGIFGLLYQAGGICLFWHFFFMVITMGVLYKGVKGGIEYWSRIMTTTLLLLLLALFFYSMTLSGFSEACSFIFNPEWGLLRPSGVLEALGLAFFTLSLGQGIILTYGSYMKPDGDIPQTAAIIGVMDIVVSLLAALTIFSIIFSFPGFSAEVGPGLVFQTMPILLGRLPLSLVLTSAFFILFVFTALTSAVALLEVVVANFMDLQGWSRRRSVLVSGTVIFIFGIPSALAGSGSLFPQWQSIYGMNFFDTMSSLVDNWTLPIGGLLMAIYSGWVLDLDVARREFCSGTKLAWLFPLWRFLLRWVAPLAIIFIILQRTGLVDVDALFGYLQ